MRNSFPNFLDGDAFQRPIWPSGVRPDVEIGDTGLLMGAGTVLARMTKNRGHLALDADGERLFALLSIAHGQPISARTIASIEAASKYWQRGEKALANFRLIFGDLPRLDEPVDAYRLQLAEYLLDEGMAPRTLMKELDLDPTGLEVFKYDPEFGTDSGDAPGAVMRPAPPVIEEPVIGPEIFIPE